jgi:hypothetical protein
MNKLITLALLLLSVTATYGQRFVALRCMEARFGVGMPIILSELAGEQRGDPRHKDVYMMMMFNVNYKFGSTKGAPRFFSTF